MQQPASSHGKQGKSNVLANTPGLDVTDPSMAVCCNPHGEHVVFGGDSAHKATLDQCGHQRQHRLYAHLLLVSELKSIDASLNTIQ